MKLVIHRRPLPEDSNRTLDITMDHYIDHDDQKDYTADEDKAQFSVGNEQLIIICPLKPKPKKPSGNMPIVVGRPDSKHLY